MRSLSELHRHTEPPTVRPCASWRTWDEVCETGHGVMQIGIERTACFGECPVYSAAIHADGRVEYRGDWYVERMGKHSGKASLYDFHRLAQFIVGTGFWEMETQYDFADSVVTDCPSTYVRVATADRSKIVSSYADSGPPELWAIAGLIDLILHRVEWQQV